MLIETELSARFEVFKIFLEFIFIIVTFNWSWRNDSICLPELVCFVRSLLPLCMGQSVRVSVCTHESSNGEQPKWRKSWPHHTSLQFWSLKWSRSAVAFYVLWNGRRRRGLVPCIWLLLIFNAPDAFAIKWFGYRIGGSFLCLLFNDRSEEYSFYLLARTHTCSARVA